MATAIVSPPGQFTQIANPVSSRTPLSTCPECGGEGWLAIRDDCGAVKMHRCPCQRVMRITHRIPAKYADARLTDLKIAIIDQLEAWVADAHCPGLFLHGPTGVGKTHMAVALCRELLESDHDALLISSSRFYREIRETFNNSERDEESVLRKYCRAPWLLLDDVGAGALSDFERRYLLDLLDRRAARRTIVTSNLSVQDLALRFDERIASRLSEFKVLHCAGADRRAARSRPKFAAA